MARPRILFIHNNPVSFIQTDLALLRERYAVDEWYQRSYVINIPLLIYFIGRSDLIFGWFASWHTFFPILIARVLRRPTILVVGGYDTADMPDIAYGHQRGGLKKWIAGSEIKWATALITNSEFTRDEVVRTVGVNIDRITVISHGLDTQMHTSNEIKRNLVLTVANVERSNLQRKGLELFVRAAALLPEVPFVVIGAWKDNSIDTLRSIASNNVIFTGWISHEELSDYYARANVYVQASRHEAFGLAVAEAMLSECIPVVSRFGALPTVVGDTGIYVEVLEPRTLADAVRYALTLSKENAERSRERIKTEFPLGRRRAALYDLVNTVLSGKI